MIFYALHIAGEEDQRCQLLESACRKLKIQFKQLDPYTYDFSKASPVKAGDIVYRVSRGKLLRFFEDFIVKKDTVTFNLYPLLHRPDAFLLEKQHISTPRTIFCATNDHEDLLSYVKKVGGFPVVLKALGGTRGMGVIKIDSVTSLFSIVDYLISQNKFVVMREFIPVKTSARLIVLGDQVAASMEYVAGNHDFRTNQAKDPRVVPKKFAKNIEELAIKATHAMGWEFGGVDVLINGKKAYVTEVNYPCNFVRAHKVLKKDVALEMVKYLQQKSRKMKPAK